MEDNPDDVISVISVDPRPSNYFPPTVWKWKHLLRPLHVHGADGRWGALAPWWARVWTQNPPELIYGFLVFFYDIDRRLSFTRRPNSACFILRRLTGAHGHSLNQSLFLTLHPATVWLKKAAKLTRIIRHAAEITGTSFQNFYSGAVCVTPPQLQSPSDQKSRTDKNSFIPLFNVALHTCAFNFYERLVFSSRVVRAPTKGSYLSPCDRQ